MKTIMSVALFVTSVACAFGEERVANWVQVTRDAGWSPRDSQGEVVYKDQLWIFGGWFDSFKPALRDVWSSADGKTWKLVSEAAPWLSSDIPMSLAFKDKMWFMGGWKGGRLPEHAATNEVWSSTDGKEWALVTEHAGWTPRMGAGAVVFQDKMWILGGSEDYLFGKDETHLQNDVWCSADGKQWERVTRDAGWSPRALHQAVVLDGKIWVLGGGNYVPQMKVLNDVWSSQDGVHWTQVLEQAPWKPRIWFSAAVYRERMWVLGGSTHGNELITDIWYSQDGSSWSQLKSDVIWKGRHEHSAFVFQDRLWIAGGHARPLNSEVWSLHIPEDWFREE